MIELAVRIRDEHGVEIAELDLGGGFGIAYTDEDDAPEVKDLAQSLREIVDGQCAAAGLPRPRLTVEPGRAIVGSSMVTLYTVGTIKDVDGLRTYVSVDGGMSDNIRTALYDASYTCALASRGRRPPADAVPGGGQALRERRHRGAARLAAVRPGPRRPAGGGGHRGLLPVAGQQLQPRAAARPWSRSATAPAPP